MTIPSRDSYLLDGRRVLISDLLSAGLLSAGDELVFRRPRLNVTYGCVVTEDGKLKLPSGRRYAAPSRAAVAAAGGSLDGWHAWQLAPDGPFLNDLRRELLSRVAATEDNRPTPDEARPTWRSHYEFLTAASKTAKSEPLEIKVRDLLSYWDEDSRSSDAIRRISVDLDNHGLMTDPSFLKTGIDTVVRVVEKSAEGETEAEPGTKSTSEDAAGLSSLDADIATSSEYFSGLTVGNIESANNGVETVSSSASVEQAITLMLLNDYSQLAVMNSPRDRPRAITWQSIAREQHANPDGELPAASVDATTVRFDTDLIDILPVLEREGFAFVTDSTNRVSGIVTTADVVHSYGELATPFFLIGELDGLLRRLISDTFTLDEVKAVCDSSGSRSLASYERLTMGDYERLLEEPTRWDSLDWPLDRKIFIKRLALLRQTRNDLMHFNPDPVSEQAIARVRHVIAVVKKYAGY